MPNSSPYTRGLWGDLVRSFRGPQRAVMVMIFVAILAASVLSVVCFITLLDAGNTRSQILWGVAFLASFLTLGLLKMGYYQRIDRLAILDALKEIRDKQQG